MSGINFDVNWNNRQSGNRCKGGMISLQALIWNIRICRSDAKGEVQVEIPRGESTNAEHRDGSACSSVEISVMEMERRS